MALYDSSQQRLEIKSWEEIKAMITNDSIVSHDMIDALESVCRKLKADNKDYFYYGEIEFGKKLIEGGKIAIKNPLIKYGSYYNPSKIDFKKDILYTDDPLGIVLEGKLEVLFENASRYSGRTDKRSYNVYIATLHAGSLFGTYGTIDYHYQLTVDDKSRRWSLVSGNGNTSWVATSLHNQSDRSLINDLPLRKEFEKMGSDININKWTAFLNTYITEKACTKIIYVPVHTIHELFKLPNNPILKIGWEQSFNLRNAFLKDNKLTNKILMPYKNKFKHERLFLIELYEYLLKVINGKAECLIPTTNEDHHINIAFSKLNEKINESKTKTTTIQHVCFEFDTLNGSDFGILLLPMLPLKNEYTVNSIAELITDLRKMSHDIEDESDKIENHLLGCVIKIQVKDDCIDYLITHKKFKEDYLKKIAPEFLNTNLTSAEFLNFIIVKRKK